MAKFKIGDIVYLNSNPEIKMTVFNPKDNYDYVVLFYYNTEKSAFMEQSFIEDMLTKVDDSN